MIMPDDELMTAFRCGNDIVFITLYNRYKLAIYKFCLKMLGDTHTAKDAVQCTFLKVYERRAQLEQTDKFRYWLFAIARNECITQLRKNKVFSPLSEDIADPDPDSSISSADRDGEAELVNEAIIQLEPDLREVIILREYQNLSYHDIGEIIGIPEKTVKSRLFRARQMLYEILKPYFCERK